MTSSPASEQPGQVPKAGGLQRLFIIFLIANLLLACPLAYYLNLRSDEGYAMDTSSRDLGYAVYQAIHFELQAPFYFGLLSIWRKLHDSVFFARLLSIIFIVSTAFMIREIGKRYLPQVHPAWMVGVFLFNPVTIYTEVDARCYALVLLLVASMLVFLYDGFLAEKPQLRARLAYMILATIALQTHYYTGFFLAAAGGTLLVHGKWKAFGQYCLMMVVPAIGLGILAQYMSAQYAQKVRQADPNNLLESLVYLVDLADNFLLATDKFEIVSLGLRWAVRGVLALLILTPFVIYFRQIRLGDLLADNRKYIITIALNMMGCYALIYMIWGEEFVVFKFLSPFLTPIIFTAFSLIELLRSKRMLALYTTLILLCYGVALKQYYTPAIKSDDYKGVAQYLTEQSQPGQPILIFENIHEMLLKYYYHGPNQLVALPYPIDFSQPWGHERWVLQSEEQVKGVFDTLPADMTTCWLVTHDQEVIKSVSLNHHFLESYVAQHYDVVSTLHFEEMLTVRQLRKKAY
ncbi:MAG: glycosyltransferase family 39 protein [Bacteroidia bacterium]|nr:glycosyltransferase family 39 protein [Bacteroidia bacterium]